MQLARSVYEVTEQFPKREIFGLSSQLRRAAVSVPSNIGEGHGRLSDQLFRTFLAQARGSLFELQTQITLSADLGFVVPERSTALIEECTQLTMMLNGLLKALEKKPGSLNR